MCQLAPPPRRELEPVIVQPGCSGAKQLREKNKVQVESTARAHQVQGLKAGRFQARVKARKGFKLKALYALIRFKG